MHEKSDIFQDAPRSTITGGCVLFTALCWTAASGGTLLAPRLGSHWLVGAAAGFFGVVLLYALFVLILLAIDALRAWKVEQWIAKRGVSARDEDRPDGDLIAPDVAITGRWQNASHPFQLDIAQDQRGSNRYRVGVNQQLNPTWVSIDRVATWSNGELRLERPIGDLVTNDVYTRIYAIRWQGMAFLLASTNIAEFESLRLAGQDAWKAIVLERWTPTAAVRSRTAS